jgi:AraC family transcriptional regulator of adaptative response/methylated-DNA-[protein]-cysteine methyltransferase
MPRMAALPRGSIGTDMLTATLHPIDEATALAAFEARDKTMDGRFVIAVKTTGIYCKPSCPARRPKRENFDILANGADARAQGYRPCLRCKPDEVGRDKEAVARAVALIEASESAPTLDDLAEAVGYTPHHFQRLFTRAVGVSPASYARALRAGRLEDALDQKGRITDAIYDAGYEAPSRAYADAAGRLGMSPSAWRKGGAGKTIRYAVVDSSLGSLLVAATDQGLCRISFDEGEADLRARFPQAQIVKGDGEFTTLVAQVVALVDDPSRAADLPVDVAGTAFQQAVWAALRAIPAGETRTYSQVAAAVGRPAAVRAAGTACGDNSLAILIPCHRVLRTDGSLGGYAYGLERKERLLEKERLAGGDGGYGERGRRAG